MRIPKEAHKNITTFSYISRCIKVCGIIGKVDNCQVGVLAAYASHYGYALVNKQLFIPKSLFTDDYAPKKEKCQVPEGVEFKTKPQLAIEMFRDLQRKGTLP